MPRTLLLSAVVLAALCAAPAGAAAQLAAGAAASAPAAAPAKLFADGRLVTRDRFTVEVVGAGPDVVLIPGLSSSKETWRRTAERLRGRYRLHLVQVAGFAGEPPRANASGAFFDPVLAELDAYMAALPKPPVVMGHSLGGTLALAMAERSPARMSKVLIVDSLPFYGVLMGGPSATADSVRPMAEGMRKQMVGRMPEPMARQMAAQMVTAPADVDRVVAWMMASDPQVTARAMTDDMVADLRPDLGKVRSPVTVIYETPIKPMIEAGYAALGPKTLVAVPDAKHFIMYDQPARFDAEVDRFLGVPSPGR